MENILRTGIVYTYIHSNVPLVREKGRLYQLLRTPSRLSIRAAEVLKHLPDEMIEILKELGEPCASIH